MTRILAADDQPDNLELLCQILEDDFDVITASDGVECLQRAKDDRPDVILLDVQMPEMDGYEVFQKLQEHEATCAIPVIFITGRYRDPDRVVRGLVLGAFDYITKPIDDDELLARVATAVRIRKAEEQLRETTLEQERTVHELQQALAHVETLRGLISICSNCNKIRDDDGYWHRLENYLTEHTEATFSHGLCKDCAKELYPGLYEDVPAD